MDFTIRPLDVERDIPAVAALRRRCFPYEITLERHLLWSAERTPEQARARWFAAESGGRIIGYARAALVVTTGLAGQGTLIVMVDPGHRRRGAGSALADAAEAHLADAGAVVVRAAGPEDPAAPFAERRGYLPRSTSSHQVLDLAGLPPVPPRPDGVELRPASAYADDPRPVHAVDEAVSADEPGDAPTDSSPYRVWLETVWEDPRVDRDLSLMVLSGGEPIGIVAILSDGERTLRHSITGTVRAHRGRGIATYAKTAALHRARERGFTASYTENDTTNAPMLAINERLGYRPHATETVYRRDL
ncbi:GNAT family N-acetyltransferase [Nocardiopsis potens]|uniref:GNAT family N-acetyltransferase n=1 Tax=Nocardiopsis potens TaxID=1246458 RepID=UPI00034DE8F5|nr:GNAT family N-acetyltransferase [Nocardiopsis potens]